MESASRIHTAEFFVRVSLYPKREQLNFPLSCKSRAAPALRLQGQRKRCRNNLRNNLYFPRLPRDCLITHRKRIRYSNEEPTAMKIIVSDTSRHCVVPNKTAAYSCRRGPFGHHGCFRVFKPSLNGFLINA